MKLLPLIQTFLASQSSFCHLCGAFLWLNETTLCDECQKMLDACRIDEREASVLVGEQCRAVSAYWHEAEARELVLLLKYRHDRAAASPLAFGLCAAYLDRRELFPKEPRVCAVPSHPERVRERGYAQAEVLAEAFASLTGLPYRPGVLTRVKAGGSQVGRSQKERLSAMKNAFQAAGSLAGQSFLLIDDVYTTGSTALACVEALRQAGAEETCVLTVCRA